MFPITDLDENEEVTRDFVEGSGSDEITRSALLAPWSTEFPEKFLNSVSLEQGEPSSDYFSVSVKKIIYARLVEEFLFFLPRLVE